ncbi:MAG: hypothetical protein U0230_13140 [Polyangiales bacterium]
MATSPSTSGASEKAELRRFVDSVRRVLVARELLRGLLAASTLAATLAVAIAVLAPRAPRLPAAGLVLLGPLVGLFLARRRMPTESDLVAYVDHRLGADSTLLTLHELPEPMPAGLASLRGEAERILRGKSPRDVRPRRAGRELLALPFVLGAFAIVPFLPVPPAAVADPGAALVRLDASEALARIERLADLPVSDRESLRRASREAEELRQRLAEGTTRADALDRLQRIREGVEAASRSESPSERRARDAAAEALSSEPGMAEALANRDLARLAREVQRAAARREAADRARARESLRRAAEAARGSGDDRLADSLLHQESLLRHREEQAELARQLAEAMPELAGGRVGRALERLSRDGDGAELDAAMVEAMREAWSRLSPEERRRLAEAVSRAAADENRRAAEAGDGGMPSSPRTADEIERELREALANLDRLSLRVGGGGQGGLPIPGGPQGGGAQGGGGGNPGGTGQGGSGTSGNQAGAGGGTGRGGGPGGTPRGTTAQLGGDDLLARVRPTVAPGGTPSASWVEWVDPTGSEPTVGGGGAATGPGAAGQPGAVEHAPIPEEYRDHVRAYFERGQESER